MSVNCQDAANAVGNGVAAALQGVDCVAAEMTGEAFGRLFAPGGALGPVLTILLALFIALFAIGLLLGRTNLSVRSLVPRMITLGLVLTFATSWIAYQAVVWNLAIGAPDYLASTLTGDAGSATASFAGKIDVVFTAIEEATRTQAGGQGAGAQGGQNPDVSAFSPEGMLWLGAMLLLLGTVGVLVTARIGLAVLVALGPIFVVMALFNGTRGLFTGWLKGVVMLALTPLFAVLGGSVMLELAVPVLSALALSPGEVPARPAMAFFMIGAVHVALMIMVLKVSAAMVSGWRVFGIVPNEAADRPTQTVYTIPQTSGVAAQGLAASGIASSPARQIPISAVTTGAPANDPGTGLSPAAGRETRIINHTGGSGQVQTLTANPSRTRGIGNRFKSPGAKSAGDKAGSNPMTEKFK